MKITSCHSYSTTISFLWCGHFWTCRLALGASMQASIWKELAMGLSEFIDLIPLGRISSEFALAPKLFLFLVKILGVSVTQANASTFKHFAKSKLWIFQWKCLSFTYANYIFWFSSTMASSAAEKQLILADTVPRCCCLNGRLFRFPDTCCYTNPSDGTILLLRSWFDTYWDFTS